MLGSPGQCVQGSAGVACCEWTLQGSTCAWNVCAAAGQGSACRAVLVLQAVNVSAAETPAEPQPSHSSLPGH